MRLHDAPHTALTVVLTAGVPPRVAMQVLGHSQSSLTLGTYSHVMPELATEAANPVGEGLRGARPRAIHPWPPPRSPRALGHLC